MGQLRPGVISIDCFINAINERYARKIGHGLQPSRGWVRVDPWRETIVTSISLPGAPGHGGLFPRREQLA
jgi:hypothetical protein